MEQWQLNRLDSCLLEITKSLDINETLLKLQVRGIFDINDRQLVQNDAVCKTGVEKRSKIIDLLRTRGADSYWALCHVVESKTPQLYHLLHRVDDESEIVCPECTTGQSFTSCSYCTGLLTIFSNPTNGIFIENPEGIVDLFENLKKQLDAKENGMKRCNSEVSKLKQDYRDLFARHIRDTEGLTVKEKALQDKEKEYERLLNHKDTSELERVQLNLKIEELKSIITNLDSELCVTNKQVEKYQEDPLYMNQVEIDKSMLDQLTYAKKMAEKNNEELRQEALHWKRESSRMKIHNESLEEILQRQKSENQRIFNDLNNKYELLQNQTNSSAFELDGIKDQLQVTKLEKEETMRERDHLLNKVYEKNKLLKETQLNLHTTEQELQSLKRINRMQLDRIHHLKTSKEDILRQYKTVVEERDKANENIRGVQEARDRLVLQIVDLSHTEGEKIEFEKLLEQSCHKKQEEIDEWKQKYNDLLKIHPDDNEVVLQRSFRDNGRFGVRFGTNKGPVFLGESKVVVVGIDLDAQSAPLANVQAGDYVIRINDANVQDYEMSAVKSLCPENAKTMKLVLRKQRNRISTETFIKLDKKISSCNHFDDLGMSLGLYARVKNNGSAAAAGIQDLDEITTINRGDHIPKFLIEMKEKILKGIRKKDAEIYLRRYMWNQEDKRLSRMSSMSEASLKSASHHPRSGSRLSDSTTSSGNSRTSLLKRNNIPRIPQENPRDSFSDKCDSISTASSNTTNESPLSQKVSAIKSRPLPLPREPTERSPLPGAVSPSSPLSRLNQLEYTRDEGPYSYVTCQQFDAEHNPVLQTEPRHYENELITKVIEKEPFVSFGFQMIGGNKSGIFVKAVDHWKAAEKAGVKTGFKILKIDDYSLERVAFCYAVDVLQRCSSKVKVTFVFEEIPIQQYEEILKKKPYDSFHVRTLRAYQARLAGEISFRAGEVLCVTNSYVFTEPSKPFKWKAMKEELSGAYQISGLIPRQISSRSPSAVSEHTYEEIEHAAVEVERGGQPNYSAYYVILESVGEVLV